MSNAPANSGPAAPAAKAKQPRTTRIVVVCIVLGATIGAVLVGIPWAKYRFNNVVLREASVRGVVTKVGSRIDGRVRNVEVELGQIVSKGEILLRLEDSHLQAALERSRGELQSALRELENEKMSIQQNRRRLTLEIERAKGGIKKATGELAAQNSNLAKLQKQYDRISMLYTNGAAATAELDKVGGDRDRALAYVSAASGTLESAESIHEKAVNDLDSLQVRENRLGVLEAQISVARAKVAAAESDLEAAVIRAPEDGRVVERIINVGGSAKVGEPMISLWIGKAWIEAWADERDLSKIQIDNPVDISFDTAPDRKLAGRVESIGLVTDKQIQPGAVPSSLHAFVRQSAMVPIRIALQDENPPVQLGLSVLVGIRKGSESQDAGSRTAKHGSKWIPSPTATATTNSTVSKL